MKRYLLSVCLVLGLTPIVSGAVVGGGIRSSGSGGGVSSVNGNTGDVSGLLDTSGSTQTKAGSLFLNGQIEASSITATTSISIGSGPVGGNNNESATLIPSRITFGGTPDISGATITVINAINPPSMGFGRSLFFISGFANNSGTTGGDMVFMSGQTTSGGGPNGPGMKWMTTAGSSSDGSNSKMPITRLGISKVKGFVYIGDMVDPPSAFTLNSQLFISSRNAPADPSTGFVECATGTDINPNTFFKVTVPSTTFGPGHLRVVLTDAKLGVGIINPIARVDIAAVAGSSYALRVTSPTQNGDYLVSISSEGAFSIHAGSPTITSCGTTPSGALIRGANQAGTVQIGGGAQTSCTIIFNPPFKNQPYSCTVSDNSTTVPADVTTCSNTQMVVGFGALGGGIFYYHVDTNE